MYTVVFTCSFRTQEFLTACCNGVVLMSVVQANRAQALERREEWSKALIDYEGKFIWPPPSPSPPLSPSFPLFLALALALAPALGLARFHLGACTRTTYWSSCMVFKLKN